MTKKTGNQLNSINKRMNTYVQSPNGILFKSKMNEPYLRVSVWMNLRHIRLRGKRKSQSCIYLNFVYKTIYKMMFIKHKKPQCIKYTFIRD